MSKNLICEKCGGETKPKLVDKIISHKGQEYSIENIEAEVCPNCGERYFSAKTLLEIESRIEQGKYKKAA